MRTLSLISCLALLLLPACASVDASAPQASIGNARVFYKTAGAGEPTIVFESGLGDGMDSWTKVYNDLAASHHVFAYDRPGYGRHLTLDRSYDSDRDGKRTGDEVARHLHDVLAQAGVKPPYVLVGHSVGGMYSLSFAQMYPGEVAGIVLVDARLPGFTEACEQAHVGLCDIPGVLKLTLNEPMRSEAFGMAKTDASIGAPAQFGPYPVTVIAATKPSPGASEGFQDVWRATARQFAARVTNGRYVEVPATAHYVHQEHPELVEQEIERVVEAGHD